MVKVNVYSTNETRKKAYEKELVRKEIEKRFKTSFIFSIAKFEEHFGYLWGHDEDREPTVQELELKEKFLELRKAILDNGNNQIRAFNLMFNKLKIEKIENQIEMRKENDE